MTTAPASAFVALVYPAGDSAEVDRLLEAVVSELGAEGIRLAGMIQRQQERPGRCRCDIIGIDLASGREVPLSQDRGPAARGCRLDTHALEDMVGLTEAAIEAGAQAVVLNRFGKREAEGGGFRDVLATAVARQLPVLVPVALGHLDAWRAFAGGLAEEAAATAASVQAWRDLVLATRGVGGREPLRPVPGCAAAAPGAGA